MAGGFSPVDGVRCDHYAAFASHLGRREFDWIYWCLFIFVILMLFLASWQYSGCVVPHFPIAFLQTLFYVHGSGFHANTYHFTQ